MFFLSLSISLVIYKKLYSFQELTGSNSEQESGTSSEQQSEKRRSEPESSRSEPESGTSVQTKCPEYEKGKKRTPKRKRLPAEDDPKQTASKKSKPTVSKPKKTKKSKPTVSKPKKN